MFYSVLRQSERLEPEMLTWEMKKANAARTKRSVCLYEIQIDWEEGYVTTWERIFNT